MERAQLTFSSRSIGSSIVAVACSDALALASAGVDLRVTQVVNDGEGVHAVLPDGAFR